ncbi:MAG: hypothetical protein KC503_26950, partial [Myxococcales bacterium]|nr:hypothetical protein [Myxococcales bacterium]
MQLPTERDRLVEARRISSCGRLRPRFRRLAPKLLWLTSMAFLLSYPLVSHVLRRTSRKARCSAPQARARAAARTPATAARPTPNVASLVGAADPSDPWA